MKTGEKERLAELVGRIIQFKATNIKAAEWETGILEAVTLTATRGHIAHVRMKGGTMHDIRVSNYIIESRA